MGLMAGGCDNRDPAMPIHSPRRVAYSTFMIEGDTTVLEMRLREVRDQAGRGTFTPS